MRKPVVAVLLLAIVAVVGVGVWADHEPEETFCTLAAPLVPPPPGHAGAFVSVEDLGDPGPDHCDGDRVPAGPLPGGQEHLVLGSDCAFRDVDGEVVATTLPEPDGFCER